MLNNAGLPFAVNNSNGKYNLFNNKSKFRCRFFAVYLTIIGQNAVF